VDYRRTTPVVESKLNRLDLRQGCELAKKLGPGAGKAVDGLIGIAYCEQTDTCAKTETSNDPVKRQAEILVLVND
jgi:hypothetical protein